MKVHSAIEESKPELVDSIKKNAERVGLDKIDFDKFYTLKKLGAKNESPRGYPNKYTVTKGNVVLIGNTEVVAIFVNGIHDWFKTSAVVGVEKTDEGIRIETENSYYLLEA